MKPVEKEKDKEQQFPETVKGKLNIYFHVSENSGVGYYRQYLPAFKLRESGIANTMISDFRWGEGEHVEPELPLLMKIANWADIIVVGRKDIGQFYSLWGSIKEKFNLPIVMDIDDNIHHVRPQNPGYQGYFPGAEAITWNKYAVSKVFDAITVTTKNLIEVNKKYNPKIFLLPNAIDVEWWNKEEKKVWNDNKIRIGFIASAAHAEGVQIIKKPMLRILEKYPNVEFYITHMFRKEFEKFDDRVISVPWIKLEEWPKGYKALGLDIGLAPLADNMFNRAKSNLRWMEYSVQSIPSVVSPVEAYNCVNDGVDGFFATEEDEWYNRIADLVESKELRDKVGTTALQRIEKEFNIDINIKEWLTAYQDIVDKYHSFFGPKRSFLIDTKGLRELGGGKRKRLG